MCLGRERRGCCVKALQKCKTFALQKCKTFVGGHQEKCWGDSGWGRKVVQKNYKCFSPSTVLPKDSAFPISIGLDLTRLILGGRVRRVHEEISKSPGTFIVHDYLPLILYWPDLCGKDIEEVFIL